jgi:hypothetical protein
VSVAANVERLRLAGGQTIEQVAAGSRIQQNVMYGITFGRVVRDDQIEALARHFGVTIEELEA